MSHNALKIVDIRYVFMKQGNGPVLCEATHVVVIENTAFRAQANCLFDKSNYSSSEGKWLHLISASID